MTLSLPIQEYMPFHMSELFFQEKYKILFLCLAYCLFLGIFSPLFLS